MAARAGTWLSATSQPGARQDRRQNLPGRELTHEEHRAGIWTASAPSPPIISPQAPRPDIALPKSGLWDSCDWRGDLQSSRSEPCNRHAVSVVAWCVSTARVLAPTSRVVVFLASALGGPVMTVTYEPPRLNRTGAPHALTLI